MIEPSANRAFAAPSFVAIFAQMRPSALSGIVVRSTITRGLPSPFPWPSRFQGHRGHSVIQFRTLLSVPWYLYRTSLNSLEGIPGR
jgi:hypothetical protein